MDPLRGIGLKLAAVVLFVTMQVLVKALSDRIPPGEIMFFRSLFALPVIVVWLAWLGELGHGLRTRNPVAHVWRGLFGSAGMGLSFAALGLLPLPEVTAIGFVTPILVVAFAAMFLGERVGPIRLSAVVLGLAGVMVILSPRFTGFGIGDDAQTLGATLMLTSAVCASLAQVFVRKMVRHEHPAAIVFWFSVTATAISLATLPYGWVLPDPGEAALLVLIGLIGGAGQIFLTSAYRFADASLVAPFDYTTMVFALVAGYLIFAEVPTLQTLAGSAIVIAAGLMIILRERWLQIERGKARRAGASWKG